MFTVSPETLNSNGNNAICELLELDPLIRKLVRTHQYLDTELIYVDE